MGTLAAMLDRPLVDVLMPYRPANQDRVQGLHLAMYWWEHIDYPARLLIGGDGRHAGVWSKAKAVNRLLAQATSEAVLMYGSDHIPPTAEKLAEIVHALHEHPFVGCFTRHSTLSRTFTRQAWAQAQQDQWPIPICDRDFEAHAPFALGVVAARRDALVELGGLDERFSGWGGEDVALRVAAAGLWGPVPQMSGTVVSTWHPAASRDRITANMRLVDEYNAANAAGRMAEYLTETAEARRGGRPAKVSPWAVSYA